MCGWFFFDSTDEIGNIVSNVIMCWLLSMNYKMQETYLSNVYTSIGTTHKINNVYIEKYGWRVNLTSDVKNVLSIEISAVAIVFFYFYFSFFFFFFFFFVLLYCQLYG
eukprot:157267_1